MTDIKISETVVDGIVVENNTHNVLIVGYQDDGDLIYMDPEYGSLREAPENLFNFSYAFPISGEK